MVHLARAFAMVAGDDIDVAAEGVVLIPIARADRTAARAKGQPEPEPPIGQTPTDLTTEMVIPVGPCAGVISPEVLHGGFNEANRLRINCFRRSKI